MQKFIIPEGYTSPLSVRQTEAAIAEIKKFFENELAGALNLTRVSAPLFVRSDQGINDNLDGVQRPVSFDIREEGAAEIVHSLAKWKRLALARYGFRAGEGLYADMNAIRRDETTDNFHSIYVDQWDWEMAIRAEERTTDTLFDTVRLIYRALKKTEEHMAGLYDYIKPYLPDDITFISSQELEDLYPAYSPRERETLISRDRGAVFVTQIGGYLNSGIKHDDRAPDYDDWDLNGDIIVYYPLLDTALELSSMGIRVDETALSRQLEAAGCPERANLKFHRMLLEGELPASIGGGIGQSRVCMFCLRKAHIGEVQSSVWPEDTEREAASRGISLL